MRECKSVFLSVHDNVEWFQSSANMQCAGAFFCKSDFLSTARIAVAYVVGSGGGVMVELHQGGQWCICVWMFMCALAALDELGQAVAEFGQLEDLAVQQLQQGAQALAEGFPLQLVALQPLL